MHYSANAVVYYCTTECYVATVHYSLGVFATVCYSQNWGLLMKFTRFADGSGASVSDQHWPGGQAIVELGLIIRNMGQGGRSGLRRKLIFHSIKARHVSGRRDEVMIGGLRPDMSVVEEHTRFRRELGDC